MSVPYFPLARRKAEAKKRSIAFRRVAPGLCVTVIFLMIATALPVAAEQDRVKWMAKKLLSGKDIIDYETAISKFSSISDTRVLPTLKKLTESSEVIPRAESAGVLWRYNSKEIRKLLVTLSQDDSPAVKIEAAKSLCLMKYVASLSVITEALKSKDANVRARAYRALAAINSEDSKSAVLARHPGKTQIDRIWIAYALHSMGEKPAEQLAVIERRLLSIPASAQLTGKSDPDQADLEKAARLATKGTPLRLHASSALARIANEEALNLLVLATGDLALAENPLGPRRQLRRHGDLAALALASGLRNEKVLVRLGSASVARLLHLGSGQAHSSLSSALGKCLSDESRLVRLACAQAIGDLDLQSQSGQLGKALKHEDPDTRRAAVKAFGRMNLSSSVDPLLELLGREKNLGIRRNIYKSLSKIGSANAVDPLFRHLKQLHTKGQKQRQFADEIPLCLDALAAGGDKAAIRALELLPKVDQEQRKLMTEILARSGSARALGFFIDSLRDNVPDPDGPEVRFFDSLDSQMIPQLEKMIGDETAMWIRVILARTLFKLGKKEYARGIKWGLKNEDAYMRKLAAAVSQGIVDSTIVGYIINLLEDDSRTARFAARALLTSGSPRAIEGFLGGLNGKKLRLRRTWPVIAFWDGQSSATHPFSKEVDNDRVWVVYAEDRLGRELDLFITWSTDGRIWKEPAFTGLTSFADPNGQVA
ncbi:MAG: HEAT repeat domain-containing protein, partial [Deltaproteobacteria bacterium]|nr:HEAT repeat domain-containing protein [Deltaproteobacteria bacterium]